MRSPLVVVSLGIHVVIVLGLFVAGFWRLDRLEPGRRSVDLAISPPPPPAPSGSPAAAPAQPFDKKRRRVAREVVQPVRVEPDVSAVTTTGSVAGDGDGGTGVGEGAGSGGEPGGAGACSMACGDGPSAPAPTPAPPAVEPPRIVAPAVIKGLRVAGDTQIHPSAPIKTAILRAGKTSVTALYRVCIGTRGEVASVARHRSSGYPGYDQDLEAALWTWRYRPYEASGRKVAVCGVVTFIYSIQ